jgi:hypothetical protein
VCSSPVESTLVETDGDELDDLTDATRAVDLVVVGDDDGRVRRSLFGRKQDRLAVETDAASIQVHPHSSRRSGVVGRLLERVAF